MSFEHLRAIRTYELQRALVHMPSGARVLEIGAGAGWQADILRRAGLRVAAIDLPTSSYGKVRVSCVVSYDGQHIPFRDGEFDVIFSSNVLEHVPHVEDYQSELHRVLKSTGTVIHVLPTPTWRLWTCLTHYWFIVREVWRIVFGWRDDGGEPSAHTKGRKKHGLAGLVLRVLLPARHGEQGNTLAELYLFSRLRWRRFFVRAGWVVRTCYPVRLFYTGYSVFDHHFSIRVRRLFSFVLGSSCLVYVLGNSAEEEQFGLRHVCGGRDGGSNGKESTSPSGS